jgi:hypothetical protein
VDGNARPTLCCFAQCEFQQASQTRIGSGFNTPSSWPVPLFITVVDDCGDLINSGNVIVSFSDGDPPIPRGRPWQAILMLLHLSDDRRAIGAFRTYFIENAM